MSKDEFQQLFLLNQDQKIRSPQLLIALLNHSNLFSTSIDITKFENQFIEEPLEWYYPALDLKLDFGEKTLIEDKSIIEAYENFLGEVIDVDYPRKNDTSYNLYIQLKNLVTQHQNFGRNHIYSGFTQLVFNSLISRNNIGSNIKLRELLILNSQLSDPVLEEFTKDYLASCRIKNGHNLELSVLLQFYW